MQHDDKDPPGMGALQDNDGKVSIRIAKTSPSSGSAEGSVPTRIPRTYRREFAALRARQWDKNRFSRRKDSKVTATPSEGVSVAGAGQAASPVVPAPLVASQDNSRQASEASLSQLDITVSRSSVVVPKLTSALFETAANGKPEQVDASADGTQSSEAAERDTAASDVLDQQEHDIQREVQEGLREFKAGRIECRWSDWTELVSDLQEELVRSEQFVDKAEKARIKRSLAVEGPPARPVARQGHASASARMDGEKREAGGTSSEGAGQRRAADTSEGLRDVIRDLREYLQGEQAKALPLPVVGGGKPATLSAKVGGHAGEPVSEAEQLEEIRQAAWHNDWLSTLSAERAGDLAAASERREFDAREVLIDTRNRRRGMLFLVLSGEVNLIARMASDDEPSSSGGSGTEGFLVAGAGCTFGSAGIIAEGDATDCAPSVVSSGLRFSYALKAWGRTSGSLRMLDRNSVSRHLIPILKERRYACVERLRREGLLARLAHAAQCRLADGARADRFGPLEQVVHSGVVAPRVHVIQEGVVWVTYPALALPQRCVRVRKVSEGIVGLASALARRDGRTGAVAGPDGVRTLSMESLFVVGELQQGGMLQVGQRAAQIVEDEDVRAAEAFLRRHRIVSSFIAELEALHSSYLTLHRVFWRPLKRSAWSLQGNLRLCHQMAPNAEMLLEACGEASKTLHNCLLDEPALSLALALPPLKKLGEAVALYVRRLLVATSAFSKALRDEDFLEFLAGVEEVVGRKLIELMVKPLGFCHAFITFLWDSSHTMGADERHYEVVLQRDFEELAGELRESMEEVGAVTSGELVQLVQLHKELLAPEPALSLSRRSSATSSTSLSSDPAAASRLPLRAEGRGGARWRPADEGALLWTPPHRRVLRRDEVAVLPRNSTVWAGARQVFGEQRSGSAERMELLLLNDSLLLVSAGDIRGWGLRWCGGVVVEKQWAMGEVTARDVRETSAILREDFDAVSFHSPLRPTECVVFSSLDAKQRWMQAWDAAFAHFQLLQDPYSPD